ncbi:hypothetical protein [Kitasatospora sp. NPDC059827]|uniref:hypothetical protein n=1 Tax=Kitasatospora sp. NPDC059827 TaxID=3346964 RepID=UPI00365904F1
MLRGGEHVLLLYGADRESIGGFDELASFASELTCRQLTSYVILADGARPPAGGTRLPVYRDTRGEFARAYATQAGPTAFVVRPDGYLGTRLHPPTAEGLTAHLARVFRTPRPEAR